MKLSYSAAWDDTVAMLRGSAPLAVAIAGVFMFMPSLLAAYFLPVPEPSSTNPWIAVDHFAANGHWFLLVRLFGMVGAIAILQLLFGRGQLTVGAALSSAFVILPFYFLGALLTGIISVAGLFLLIIPGLYLAARTALTGPIIVAEGRRNPVDAVSRSFALTKGNGWAILGLMSVVGLAGLVILMVVTVLFGSLFVMIAGKDLGGLLAMIVNCIATAAFTVVMLVLTAAVYRYLEAGRSAAGVFD